jgi:hypothetical protein
MCLYFRYKNIPRLFPSCLARKGLANLPVLCTSASRSTPIACQPRAWVLASQQCRTFQLPSRMYDSRKDEQCLPLETKPYSSREHSPNGDCRKVDAHMTDANCIYRYKPIMTCAEDLAVWQAKMKYFADVDTALSDTDVKDPAWGFVVRKTLSTYLLLVVRLVLLIRDGTFQIYRCAQGHDSEWNRAVQGLQNSLQSSLEYYRRQDLLPPHDLRAIDDPAL